MEGKIMRVEKVGTVGVDSGTIAIMDPCYHIRDRDKDGQIDDNGPPSEELSQEVYKLLEDSLTTNITGKFADIEYGVAVACRSGYGDGIYPVYGIIASNDETNGMGERCMGLLIDFSTNNTIGSVLGGAMAAHELTNFGRLV
jgi:hypothetical protein